MKQNAENQLYILIGEGKPYLHLYVKYYKNSSAYLHPGVPHYI